MAEEPDVAPAGEGGFEGLIAGGGPQFFWSWLGFRINNEKCRFKAVLEVTFCGKNNFGKQPYKSEFRNIYFIFDRFKIYIKVLEHLAGRKGNIAQCLKVPQDIKDMMDGILVAKSSQKAMTKKRNSCRRNGLYC